MIANPITRAAVLAVAAVALLACGDDGTSTGSDAASGGGADLAAGTFQLTTHAVDDACLDGGLDLLFMPQGENAPYDLQFPTEIPAYAALPQTFTIQLQDPFDNMEITLEQDGADRMVVNAGQQTNVVVDADNYGDCNVDMTIDVSMIIIDQDNLDVNASLSITGAESTGDTCPNFNSDPCLVRLTMKGRRVN